MLRIGQAGLVAMQRRAFDQGLQVDGAPMEPYAPGYAASKRTGHDRVDLTDTGRMRRSLRVTVHRRSGGRDAAGRFQRAIVTAVIDLRDPRVPAYAVYTNRRRPWFGFGRPAQAVVAQAFVREMNAAWERAR